MNWLSLLGLDGLLARWRANAVEASIAAEDRMALACLEWQDLRRGLGQLLWLSVALIGLTVVAAIMLSLAVLVCFWDDPGQRMLAAALIAFAWLAGWAGALAALVCVLRRASRAMALTRRELAQDWRELKERL